MFLKVAWCIIAPTDIASTPEIKYLPKFLGYIGKLIGKVRGITSDFRETVDDAIKNSELEEVRKEISFTDPELSKNFNQVLNPNNNNKKKENSSELGNDKETKKEEKNYQKKKILKQKLKKAMSLLAPLKSYQQVWSI